ncbi:phosphatidate cytidylyltransferase [Microbacterium sp.]|uniref:phosphatidate cytidylyltransferase n=1 Tax=Microbacterium sp. TaxID=51671 RepID=UPI00333E4F44
MSDESDSQDRPRTRREARDVGTPDDDGLRMDGEDVETPVRGIPVMPAPAPAVPLEDEAFPGFDARSIPPRPPHPADDIDGLSTGDQSAIREQWRAARDEIGTHVAHARDQFEQANERINQRTGRNLFLAIAIGLVFGAVLLGSLLFNKVLFVPIAVAIGVLATYELARALRAGGRKIDVIPQMVAGGLLIVSGYFAAPWLVWVALFAAVAFTVVWRVIGQMVEQDGRTYGAVIADLTVGAFIQVYVPFLTAVALMLLNRENGEWWVLSFIAIAVAADTAAYATGLAFGRHPMAPRISPKKTWEGFAGAVVGSLLAGALLGYFLLHIPIWAGLVLGAAVLLSATMGDLGESMLKRDLGIKDMSSWLPGHGGLLDRLDSILPSTVPALALYVLLSSWMVS